MSDRKSNEQRLLELEKKLEQLKAQKKALQARQRTAEQKARTRRLIQNGALSEQYFNCKDIEPEEFEKLLQKIVAVKDVNILLAQESSERAARAEREARAEELVPDEWDEPEN